MLKNDFPIFHNNPGLVYLDSAATLQKPASVIEGVSRYLANDYANIHRGRYSLSERSEHLYWQARKAVANFLHADDDEIIFTGNATDSVNKLVKSLIFSGVIGEGDAVVLSELEHHANIVPRQMAAKQHGIIIKYVACDAEGQIDMQDLAQQLDTSVKIVALTMASNVTGGVTDMQQVLEIVKTTFVSLEGEQPLVAVDASQAVVHAAVDVEDLGVDFLYFTGHKLGALPGIGVLRGKKEHLALLQPAYGGGGMVDEVTKEGYTCQQAPDKFEAGTPNIVGALSLQLAIDYLQKIGGYEQLAAIEDPLMTYCFEEFAKLAQQGVTLLGPIDMSKKIGVFSFLLPPGKNATQLGQYMADKNICIRCGAQCAHIFHAGLADRTGGKACIQQSCRISLWGYNEQEDVRVFFDALQCFLGERVSDGSV